MPAERKDGGAALPIAVVGLACRFPGANDPAEFWTLLEAGGDAVGEIPEDRWDVEAHYDPDPNKPGKMYTRAGGFVPDIDKFDAGFFGISPREARRVDPQQRLLLELTWEALEDAGIVPARIAGSQTGVFVGISVSDYATRQREEPEHVDAYVMAGSALSNAANRVSYIFDLHGPSFAVDTACSSSLVALHQACVSLWRGESSLAVAAGVNALLSPSGGIGFSKAHMLSPTGRCHPFDAAGDGYVRSEGGAVLILKPLAQAIADKDPVHAVIVGSGVNSDGRTTGLAMPNQAAQEALLRQVYTEAGVDPATVDYIEAHGTGTTVGDPIECGALGRVFGLSRAPGDPCRIGSVKGNIGHLEPASGLAGLLKVILAIRHRALPRTAHFTMPNPQIPFADLNLEVVAETSALGPKPLTMGVNSFGFGGTNAHVILRQPDTRDHRDTSVSTINGEPAPDEATKRPLLISAHDPEALRALARCYAGLLRSPNAPDFAAVCRNAATRRTHHRYRLAVVGANGTEAADRLDAFAANEPRELTVDGQMVAARRLAFVFAGNGSQWRGMGSDLCEDPNIAVSVARVDAVLEPLLGWSVGEALRSEEPPNLYAQTEFAQPTLFALQVAIVEWLRAHGIEADAVLGHSVGEVAAAWAAGALSLGDACRVIAERSRAQGRTAGTGRMAAVGLSPAAATERIAPYRDDLAIAAVNTPNSVTIAGDAPALDELGAALERDDVFFRALNLDYAFHTRHMDPIRDVVWQGLQGLSAKPGSLQFISSVSGAALDGTRLDASYWWDNIRQPTQFAAAIGAAVADGIDAFLEIGPHPVLAGYLRDCLKATSSPGVILPTLRRNEPERDALWMTLGRCYAVGVSVDYEKLYPRACPFVALPPYPWQRERYWFSDSYGDHTVTVGTRKHPLLGRRLATADAIWKNRLDPAVLPWISEHAIQDSVVLPGTAFIEMAIAAASNALACEAVEVEGFEIRRPLIITAGATPAIEISVSMEDGSWRLHTGEDATAAEAIAVAHVSAVKSGGRIDDCLATLRQRLSHRISGADLYNRFAGHGLLYGPAFQGVIEGWSGPQEALGRIAAPPQIRRDLADYRVHPALLDACLQIALATIPESERAVKAVFVPSSVKRIRFYGVGGDVAWSHVRLTQIGARSILTDYTVFGTAGTVVAEIDGMRLRRLDLASDDIPAYHWRYELRPSAIDAGSAADLPAPWALAPFFASAPYGDEAEMRALFDRLAIACSENGAAAEELWRAAVARYPACLATLQLIARVAEKGAAEPLARDRGFDALEQLQDSDPVFRRTNLAVVAMLQRLCDMVPPTRILRIREIAAKSRPLGTTLLSALPEQRVEYDVAGDDIPAAGHYDIVVASMFGDTDTACTDLAAAESALKPGGLLLLLAPNAGGFRDLIQTALIGGNPSTESDWPQLLHDAGFAEVLALGQSDPIAARALYLARKPEAAPSAQRSSTATWLVIADDPAADPAASVILGLERSYRRVVVTRTGTAFERLGLDGFVVPPADFDAYVSLFRLLAAEDLERIELLHLRCIGDTESSDPLSAQHRGSFDLLVIAQALAAAGLAPRTRLTATTSGAVPPPEAEGACPHPSQAPVWGLIRTIANERPDLICRLVDFDPNPSVAQAADALLSELLNGDDEDEVLLRGRGRYVPRLARGMPEPVAAPEDRGFRLVSDQQAGQDGVRLQRVAVEHPGTGEITVRVQAAGVNFRDVLQRIGLLPEEAFEGGFAGACLGLEFAGEVIAIGEGVDHLQTGDAVLGFGRGTFASHVATPAFGVFRKPPAMSFEAAATLPVAMVTVYYALHHLARLQPGERILIHGAAGGVGLAAIQFAQFVGAEIFASAGSPDKVDFLRRLGVPHIVDSRSLAFADEILETTRGEGIDVVLNSIAGEAIHKGLSILRPFGRFIELGKRDFFANSKLGLHPFRDNLQFFGVDVDRLLVDRPALSRQIFADLSPLLADGCFRALPHRVFPINRAAEAFRCMQQSRHIGKIVLTLDPPVRLAPSAPPLSAEIKLAGDTAFLVTGGRNGFGLETAAWLARKGARHLALVGRSPTTSPAAVAVIEGLRREGVAVHEFSADVADDRQLADVLQHVRRNLPPLRGVFHCAAVIQDASFANIGAAEFFEVLRPKIAGAWNLHRQTREDQLDYFVLYSSATTLLGNPGQANYVAGNIYLEALAAHRRSLGLAGSAIAWGAIGEVGHLARNPGVARMLSDRLGIKPLAPARALERLEEANCFEVAHAALADMSWSRLAALPLVARAPKYARVRETIGQSSGGQSNLNLEELRAHLIELPRDEAIVAIEEMLTQHIAGIVGVEPARLAIDKSLLDLGMDSLMLVELRLGLERLFGTAVPAVDLVDAATVQKLALRVLDGLGFTSEAGPPATAAEASSAAERPQEPSEALMNAAFERLLEADLDRAKEHVS